MSNIIGTKVVESSHPTSAAYTFGKAERDEISKLTDPIKTIRRCAVPVANPGPAQYNSGSLLLKPRHPTIKMLSEKRFKDVGSLLRFKSVM